MAECTMIISNIGNVEHDNGIYLITRTDTECAVPLRKTRDSVGKQIRTWSDAVICVT